MQSKKMWIGGQWVEAESHETFSVPNPSTDEELGRVPVATEADVNRAVKAVVRAFPIWSKMPQPESSKIVNRIAEVMRENAEELIALEVSEHGTPIRMARDYIRGGSELTEYAASISRALMGQVIPALPNTLSYLQRVPVGVCACITPWNVPFLMMTQMITPTLAAGNVCVLKPASVNSLIGVKFAEILDQAGLPAGAVNLITGPGSSVGKALASHPDVDLVRFTGSSETGKEIMSYASATVKKVVLELGGKNPVIILEDADVDKAVKSQAQRHFGNSAQNCSTPGRYYVHEKVYDEFVEKFVGEVKKIVVGDPRDENTMMGPMATKQQLEKVQYYIKSAVEKGARLAIGGKKPAEPSLQKGNFIMPAVVVDATHNMTIAREETFGPAACILKFSSEDDIIKLANDSRYGLCAVVWTKDMARGLRVMNELRVDSVYLNMPRTMANELPWGGNVKQIGVGKSDSMCGMEELTDLKLVCIAYSE
jgi:betaine-aldehyde dehydrogenase